MASKMDSIHEDIRTIGGDLREVCVTAARTEATLAALDKRLDNALPVMWEEIKAAKALAAAAGADATKAHGRIDTQRAWVAGSAATSLFFGGLLKTALAKMGLGWFA